MPNILEGYHKMCEPSAPIFMVLHWFDSRLEYIDWHKLGYANLLVKNYQNKYYISKIICKPG